jgi:hypothetical protein
MPLHFAPAEILAAPDPARADVAVFVGFVRRRPDTALSAAQRKALAVAGWIDGATALPPSRIDSLWQVPLAVESWAEFDRLFDTVARPLADGQADERHGRCAATLGAAVRSFFLGGGRCAVVVRCGDPWPVLEPLPRNDAERAARQALVASRIAALLPERTTDRFDSTGWRGAEHLLGLEQAAMLCLPDLPEVFAPPPPRPDIEAPWVSAPEQFVECTTETPGDDASGARRVAAPRLDAAGALRWRDAVGRLRALLERFRRECVFVGALPLIQPEGSAWQRQLRADPLAALLQAELLRAPGAEPGGASSAFIQLATPWLKMPASRDLPQSLLPPDGLLAGVLARNALERGTFRSAAGMRQPMIALGEPVPTASQSPDHPWSRLAERVCVFAPGPDGWALCSDVTTSPASGWRGAQASRLVASMLRSARLLGADHVFAPNGPALWTQLRRAVEEWLLAAWRAGGLGGASPDDAFEVRCDETTMTQADRDAGRLVVRVALLPAAAVDRITVTFSLLAAPNAEGRETAALADAVA